MANSEEQLSTQFSTQQKLSSWEANKSYVWWCSNYLSKNIASVVSGDNVNISTYYPICTSFSLNNPNNGTKKNPDNVVLQNNGCTTHGALFRTTDISPTQVNSNKIISSTSIDEPTGIKTFIKNEINARLANTIYKNIFINSELSDLNGDGVPDGYLPFASYKKNIISSDVYSSTLKILSVINDSRNLLSDYNNMTISGDIYEYDSNELSFISLTNPISYKSDLNFPQLCSMGTGANAFNKFYPDLSMREAIWKTYFRNPAEVSNFIISCLDDVTEQTIVRAQHLNNLVKALLPIANDCICYSDCGTYYVCTCYGNCGCNY